MRRSLASNVLTFLVVLLFLGVGLILWGQRQYTARGPLDQPICVQVERGANMAEVSEQLAGQGAVSSDVLFRLGADYTGKADELKAGSFLVPAHASMEEIVEAITRGGASTCGTEIVWRVGVTRVTAEIRELDPVSGRYVERAEYRPGEEEAPAIFAETRAQPGTRYRIAVAEGVTSWQVVEALKAVDVLSGDPGERPDEGSLAPDSYEVRPGTERAAVLAQMRERQALRIAAVWEGRRDGLPIQTPEEMLILASIIEKETGIPEERGTVASVFVNRLERGMRLQSDPTVIYGITRGEGVLGRGLRQSELRAPTPWNTYVIPGLPPTPIANPGLASLEAAVDPSDTDYLFFVADGSGGHAFAETLEEHNRNVAEWRRIEAERAEGQ